MHPSLYDSFLRKTTKRKFEWIFPNLNAFYCLFVFRYPSGVFFLTSIPRFTLFSREVIVNENARRENELYVLALMTIDGIYVLYVTMLVYLRDTVLSNNGEIFWHENKQTKQKQSMLWARSISVRVYVICSWLGLVNCADPAWILVGFSEHTKRSVQMASCNAAFWSSVEQSFLHNTDNFG